MRKISSIKVTNNYVLLSMDDKTSFKISEDDYFEYKFTANMDIDDVMMRKIEKISKYHMGYMKALDKIKYKDRTEYEIRSLLYDTFDLMKPDVDRIIKKLKRYDFIDDDRYANDFIENSRLKYHGYNKIKSGLIDVRINSDLIDAHLHYDFKKDYDLAYEFGQRSVRSIRNKNRLQTENALRQKLMYRGFKNDVISAVVSDLNVTVDDSVEMKLLEKDFARVLRRYEKRYEGYDLRSRLFNYLASRGYSYSDINDLLDGRLEDNE